MCAARSTDPARLRRRLSGDLDVICIVTRGRGISVHSVDCPVLPSSTSTSSTTRVELDALLAAPEGYSDDVPVDPNLHARRLPEHAWRRGAGQLAARSASGSHAPGGGWNPSYASAARCR